MRKTNTALLWLMALINKDDTDVLEVNFVNAILYLRAISR